MTTQPSDEHIYDHWLCRQCPGSSYTLYFQKYTFIPSTIIQTKSSATVPTKDWYKLWDNMVTALLATSGGAEGWRWRWPVAAVRGQSLP